LRGKLFSTPQPERNLTQVIEYALTTALVIVVLLGAIQIIF
jgi:hypothetical protein